MMTKVITVPQALDLPAKDPLPLDSPSMSPSIVIFRTGMVELGDELSTDTFVATSVQCFLSRSRMMISVRLCGLDHIHALSCVPRNSKQTQRSACGEARALCSRP